ncbi:MULTISPECIES: LysR family transcriptional regulator [Marinobacter]|uniref:LysR family transcriptional regulator n=1 Tax=Marinobacter TaxID=2742 RepID=UPI000DAC09FC|nr:MULTISPECIES: LysR family transcriptional regulator [Marinobacter]
MDTQLLRTFVAVAESQGFSAAAKVLHRTQSAVSLQIKRLEDQMGETLLQRTRRSVALTPAGSRLLPYARHMLKLEDEARQEMGADRQGELIRLGITEEQAMAYLPEFLDQFARQYPTVRLELTCGVSSRLVDLFQEGLLDVVLAIRHSPTRTGQFIATEPLVWTLARGKTLDDWDVLPLALNPEGCIFRAHAVAALGRAGFRWNVRYTSYSPTGVNLPVQSGLAMTIKTPRSVPEGCVVAPESAALPDLGLVEVEIHRSPAHSSEAYEAFCDTLTSVVHQAEDTA